MNTRNVYHLVTVKDGRSDGDEIIQVFSDMAAGKIPCDIKLLNYYREIPVSYAAQIVNVAGDRIELSIHMHQALVMKFDKHTLIKSKHFKDHLGIHCFAAYVNLGKQVAILSRFGYAQIKAERRSAVRVTADPPIKTTFTHPDCTTAGLIKDISETGMSVVSATAIPIPDESQGKLAFNLRDTAVSIPATFLKSYESDEGTICIFQYTLEGKVEKAISQYIYTRQVEIIRELKDSL